MRLVAVPFVAFLAACGSVAPPSEPPAYSEPPALATEGLVPILVTADLPFDVPGSRDYAARTPIVEFFEQTGSIAPPASSEILSGTWPEVGAVRRIRLTDGHYVIERIMQNEPEEFIYQIWVFTNEAARGVQQIVGTQKFIDAGPDVTRFEWTYAVKPKNAITRIFVQRQVPELKDYLQTAVDGWAANTQREAAASKQVAVN